MDYSMRNAVFFAFAGWLLFDGILCIIARNYNFLTEEKSYMKEGRYVWSLFWKISRRCRCIDA